MTYFGSKTRFWRPKTRENALFQADFAAETAERGLRG